MLHRSFTFSHKYFYIFKQTLIDPESGYCADVIISAQWASMGKFDVTAGQPVMQHLISAEELLLSMSSGVIKNS